jgi:WhiB family redox-sensing transcriptional regulator
LNKICTYVIIYRHHLFNLEGKMTSRDFFKDAACRGLSPELFYLDQGESGTATTLAVCGDCPVRLECLLYAAETQEIHGIWGGVSPRARRPGQLPRTIKKVEREIATRKAMKLEPEGRRKALKHIRETM